MQLKMISKGKNKAKVELVGETHTFADLIRRELSEDKKVKSVAYEKQHPQLGNPILIVETESEDPMVAIKKASKSIAEKAKEARLAIERATKKA